MAEEQDEVAAYLARERQALGAEADLFSSGGVPSSSDVKIPAASKGMDAFPDLETADPTTAVKSPEEPKGIDAFPDLMGDRPTGYDVRVTGIQGTGEDPEREKFESQFPDIESVVPAPHEVPYGQTPYAAQPSTGADSATGFGGGYTSVLPAPQFASTAAANQEDEDTEPIREWREKQAAEIKRRDEESKKKKEETILKAEKAIDAFYERYNAEKEKTIRQNKEEEATFFREMSENIAKGTSWERITDVLELQNSQSKTIRPSAPGGSDLARMKEILLSLRREGDRAPAAGEF